MLRINKSCAFDMNLEGIYPVYSSDEDVAALLTLGELFEMYFTPGSCSWLYFEISSIRCG